MPNPTYYDGDLRRDLVAAAVDLIVTHGPSGVSLRSVARRLGVSHAAPAHHFDDKAALFTAIAVDGFRGLDEALGAAAAGRTPLDALREVGLAYVRFAVDHPAHFAVMWRNDLLHTDDPDLLDAGGSTFELLTSGVAAAQAEGWGRGRDTRTLVHLAWSAVHGLAALWLDGPLREHDNRGVDDVAAAVADLLGSAFGSPDQQPPPTAPTDPVEEHR